MGKTFRKKKDLLHKSDQAKLWSCKSFRELLNIDESKIYNVVCIPSRAKLKIKDDGEVVRNITIVDKILSYTDKVINDINSVVAIINSNNITDKALKCEHIKNIKSNIIDKDPNKCPK